MRMWMVEPSLMCDQHLLGEHVELHMLFGSYQRGRSVKGFIRKGLVDLHKMRDRHHAISEEMVSRGMNHKSPMPSIEGLSAPRGNIDEDASYQELRRRCTKCRERMSTRGNYG